VGVWGWGKIELNQNKQ